MLNKNRSSHQTQSRTIYCLAKSMIKTSSTRSSTCDVYKRISSYSRMGYTPKLEKEASTSVVGRRQE